METINFLKKYFDEYEKKTGEKATFSFPGTGTPIPSLNFVSWLISEIEKLKKEAK